jgi:hypothetical protein
VDASVLVPRGKYQLQLTSTGANLLVPAQPAKSSSLLWSDVETVVDVADVNKRDWLVVLLLKKGRGLSLGKQTHSAVVLKFLATEKLKDKRIVVGASLSAVDLAAAQVQQRMQDYLNHNEGLCAIRSARTRYFHIAERTRLCGMQTRRRGWRAVSATHRSVPRCATIKQTAEQVSESHAHDVVCCVLRMCCPLASPGLLFIKPVVSIPLAQLDGILPARGMASSFDMKVGVVGQKGDTVSMHTHTHILSEQASMRKHYMGHIGAQVHFACRFWTAC